MPTRMFKNVGFVALIVVASIGAMVYYSLTILWPQILSDVYELSVTEVGIQSAVVGGGILLGQTCGGFALSYLPKVKWQTVIMSSAACAFVGGLASMDSTHHARTIALGL